MVLPLEGMTVIDLTRHLPGPYATMLLGDLGAEVWKIEHPSGGDVARRYPPFVDGTGAFFATLNRNKSSVTLDLKADGATGIFHRLLERADVLVESFRPGVLERIGVPIEEIRQRHADLVTCSMTGFGRKGPESSRAGHDLTYAARAGVLDRFRDVRTAAGPEGDVGVADAAPPVVPNAQVGDVAGGLFAAIRILGALLSVERHEERGEHLDISLTESALSLVAPHVTADVADDSGGRSNILAGDRPAYTVYETRDGEYLAVGALEPKFWREFVGEIDAPELETEGLAGGESARRARRTIADIISGESLETWLERFEGSDACVEPVQSLLDALDDRLFQGRNTFFELADATHVRTPATPDTRDHCAAPKLGEQTSSVLREAGYSDPEVEDFRADGIC